MKVFIFSITILFCLNIFSQEIVLESKFAVRDFKIKDNSLVYIEKRDIKSFDLQKNKPDTVIVNNSFFIGGYGLNVFYPKDTNQIITAANELVRNVSSIRFFDLQKKNVNKFEVYYSTELIDFLIIPEEKLFILSKKDLTIEIIQYGENPRYNKLKTIQLDSFARKLKYYKEKLYYIKDSGSLFEYSIKENKSRRIYDSEYHLTNFAISDFDQSVYVSTLDGNVLKINFNGIEKVETLEVSEEIIEALSIVGDKYLVVGDWEGEISIINLKTFKILRQFQNKKRIIKIRTLDENIFFTSSSDNTIRKWKIN